MSNIIDKNKYTTGPFASKKIKCNYLQCFAGLGLAGNSLCFLGGNAYKKNCNKYMENKPFEIKRINK